MKRWAFLLIFYFILACILHDTVCAQPSQTVSTYVLSDLEYESYPDFSRIIFSSNSKINYTSYELHDPYRIVIDLLGVSFCELQEYAEYDEGLVKSIELVKSPYAQKPQGLDEYFYAVDCIIITPRSDFPYTVSSTENGKIVAIDIGRKDKPSIRVTSVLPDLDQSQQIPPDRVSTETGHIRQEQPATISYHEPDIYENVIDYIDFESIDESLLIVLSTRYAIEYTSHKAVTPQNNIMLRPKDLLFTDLDEYTELEDGYIRSLTIVRDRGAPDAKTLDSYYYPVEAILIGLSDDLPFDLYSNEDSNIWVLEIYYPEIKEEFIAPVYEDKPVSRPIYQEKPVHKITEDTVPAERYEAPIYVDKVKEHKEEVILEEPEKEKQEHARQVRQETLSMMKQEIKKESMLKEEKIQQLQKQEFEKIQKQVMQKAETFDKERFKSVIPHEKGTLSLSECRLKALENSSQAKTAKHEVKVAQLKKRDAFRALFPNVKLKASHTTGDVLDDIGFTEELYGIEGEHPIYQGGRIMNAYKQSKVNVELAEAKYNKVEHDLSYKVAEAYYAIVTALMNIRLQEKLLKEAEPILRLAEKRHKAGLSTKLEMLNVQSRYNQIQFQIATAERDLALARFKMQQAMGIDLTDEDIEVSDVDTELPFKMIDVNLYECLEAAANNQPDIIVNRLLVESNEYGEKIAKGKQSLRVDLTGFYGKGDSYYNTEPKNMESNWNVGVKVSKPFWFATPSYSFTKDKTSLKVGQTDRTGSTAHAGELALYDKDALAITSEVEESRVSKQKAENELIETRRQTSLAIKEAYFNYEEAVLQVRNTIEKVRFHEETVKVAKAQSELNEALQSQLLESMIQLSDEQSVYIKALSDYNLAIIKLNNAIGIRDYFKLD
jgi:outer membrane protein